jgi:predicted amidophosphoribosyltransferase
MLERLVDLCFPPQCAACGEPGTGLCERCVPRTEPIARALPSLTVTALGAYRGALRAAVLALKDGRRDVADALGERLAALVRPGALLVPVPTTTARRRSRGIDGVELIARRAARDAGARLCRALERAAGNAQQGRSGAERRSARGRFVCESGLVAGRDVVLVDDVCTTGTTLEDCAEAVRTAGGRMKQAIVAASADDEGWP